MKRIAVLGSTGSIGTQTLDVARWRGYEIVGLAARRSVEELAAQCREFRPAIVACAADAAERLEALVPRGTRIAPGPEGAEEVAAVEADAVVAAIPGMAGLAPTLAAVRAGRRVALANKETMVVAGPLVRAEAAASGARIVPVDSEHSALYQCLLGEPTARVRSLVLTASGGPFRDGPADLSAVTPAQALQHPTWSMGPKVTVDSATLFNKGLEVLEAHVLFDWPLDRIEVVVHPQSLVHGLVRFEDGSIKAHIGPHDMRLPIQYAIEAPDRPPVPLEPMPLAGTWTFQSPDRERFPCLDLAYRAGRMGGTAPAALNAADEVAVEAFLAGELSFPGIPATLTTVLADLDAAEASWDAIREADVWARARAQELVREGSWAPT